MFVNSHKGKRYFLQKHPASGDLCTIYSVAIVDEKFGLFNRFIEENSDNGVFDVISRLKSIGNITGANEEFFKFEQHSDDNRICYLYAEPKNLRLYCVCISEKIIIIGGGGAKNVRAWQDDDKLKDEVHWMIQISSDINDKIANKELAISTDGYRLEGNLKFNYGN